MLGVLYRVFQGCPGDANAAGCHVHPAHFQTAHDLVETLAFLTANQIPPGDPVIVKGKLAGVHALISKLGNIPCNVEPRALFGDEDAHAAAGRVGVGVGLGHQSKGVAVSTVGDEGFGAVDHVFIAIPNGPSFDSLDVATGIRLGDADAAPLLAGGHQW